MTVKQVFNTSAELDYPTVLPTLDLDFANSKTLDPRINFTRASGGSYVGADGLIKYAGVNEARFDHDPETGESLGLLIEESRTNLLTRSEDISNWSQLNNISAIPNQTISPNGNNTATKLIENTNNSTHVAWRGTSNTAGDIICGSVFVKAAERTNVSIGFPIGGKGIRFNFNDESVGLPGVPGWSTSDIYGVIKYPNGWYRIWVQTTASGNGTSDSFRIFTHNGSTTSYSGDGTSGIYIWGVQVERGTFPTSYIPTQASTRTRTQDFPKIIGKDLTDFYNPTEGSISITSSTYTDGSPFLNALIFTDGSLSNLNNSIEISLTSSSLNTNVGRLTIRSDGETQADVTPNGIELNLQPNKRYKMIASYKKNDFTFSVDGITYFTDTSGDVPLNISDLLIGHRIASAARLNGSVSRLTYFPKRLPNSQLQTLTS